MENSFISNNVPLIASRSEQQLSPKRSITSFDQTRASSQSSPLRVSQRESHELNSISGSFHYERRIGGSREYLQTLVFSGIDTVAYVFFAVAVLVGARIPSSSVLTLGASILVAYCMFSGFGEYLNALSEADILFYEKQKFIKNEDVKGSASVRCSEEIKEYLSSLFYMKHGFSKEDSTRVANISSNYKEYCIQLIIAEDYGLSCTDEETFTAKQRGLATLIACSVFGLIPLSGFGLWEYFSTNSSYYLNSFHCASICTFITVFALSCVKGLVTRVGVFKAGGLSLLNCLLAASAAYGFAYLGQASA